MMASLSVFADVHARDHNNIEEKQGSVTDAFARCAAVLVWR